jgi:anti-sigma factor RsiW
MSAPVTQIELHAYLDGQLEAARRAEVEAYLEAQPQEAEKLAAWRSQNDALHALFDPVLDETVPERLQRRPASGVRWAWRAAAIAGWLVLGGIVGWQARDMMRGTESASSTWARRAAVAHVVYSPEVRHPVEVGADQEAHLVNWLSKRLGTQLKVPDLAPLGYGLVWGRLLPGERGPAAQFMYQDGKGQRLTLYVRTNTDETRETAFRFAQEKSIGVFYWLDRRVGYALSGEVDKAELLRVATAVYRQLNP